MDRTADPVILGASSGNLPKRTESPTAAFEQITSSVRVAADGAHAIEKNVSDAQGQASRSNEAVQETLQLISEIKATPDPVSAIISVTDDIAFQQTY